MDDYCVNKQAQRNGDHEVHKKGCTYWPSAQNVHPLGRFATCRDAVAAARAYYFQVNGCATCSRACHTQ
jgi:hypothetical protein